VINGTLRPWGKPQWLLQMESIKAKEWFLIGAISTQVRCLSMVRNQVNTFQLAHAAFLEIIDSQSDFSDQTTARREANRACFLAEVREDLRELHAYGLCDPLMRLKKLVATWVTGAHRKNIILDVSCLPERFFFPMLRWLVDSTEVENLIVTCMSPARYTEEDLAYNPEDWQYLYTFGVPPDSTPRAVKRVIVGAGFLPFGLPDLLRKDYADRNIEVSVLFPFPATPASVKRSWEFVRKIELDVILKDDRQLVRIGASDLSGCFDRINGITRDGSIPTVFAPYGPKAHSVAMCLKAIQMDAPVVYTQPAFYHPEYTTGVALDDGIPAGYAYALRVNGRALY
jgi:hypothetical protein